MSSCSFEQKTFILGVGAQKAGTTWLFQYLRNHPQVFGSAIKELHYFDQAYRPDLCAYFGADFVRQLDAERAGLTDANRATVLPYIRDLEDRVAMNAGGDAAYVDFFRRRVPAGQQHFCEITPSYSLLREAGFRAIRALFPQMRVIFLMRDPIDRYHSALRMIERGGEIDANAEFRRSLETPFHLERGRYDLTITHLLRVFDRSEIFFGFYETLFTEAEIRRLTDFLGISCEAPRFSRWFNVGAPARPLAAADLRAAREVLAPVYTFCGEFFRSDLPPSWRL